MSHRRIPRPQWPLLAALFLGVIAIAVLWLILGNPLDSSDGNKSQQRYVEAIVGSPARVNPLFAPLNDTDRDLAALVFSGLTRLGPDGQVLPDLAESWKISEDGLTYIFRLRRDVDWHTGAAFTAEDAVFTYELLADPQLPSDPTLGQFWRQVSCEAGDEFTLLCELPAPFAAPFLAHTTIGLLPKHAFAGITAATIADSPLNQAPVGTGPFRLVQMDQEKAVLRANATYYGERPAIDEIEFRFFPDPSTAAAALSRGDVQGLLLGPEASQEDFDLLTSTPGLRAYTANRSRLQVPFLLAAAVIGHLPAGFFQKPPGFFWVMRPGLQLGVIGPGARHHRGVGTDRSAAQQIADDVVHVDGEGHGLAEGLIVEVRLAVVQEEDL